MSTTRPRRADCYEAQLSDGELMELHHALMAGKQTLEKIRDGAPRWREGQFATKSPSLATLSGIRDRLVMEATLRANEATTESIVDEARQKSPELTSDALDDLGQRVFKEMSLRTLDLKGWVALQKAEKGRRDTELDREKFEVAVATKLLDEALRLRAQEIADGPGTEAEKIALMRSAYFADVDALQAAGTIKIPPP
jgi:hypothetical protein